MKKLITVVLVLVMLVSILALPAAAANVQPRYPAVPCYHCDSRNTEFRGIRDIQGAAHYMYYCLDCHLYSYVPV